MVKPANLDRGIGLREATATNILAMIGVGPFLTIPFMMAAMEGPHILYGWLAGGLLALCDGLVYAQLGAALPGSGGPYVYLREAYRPFGLARFAAFLIIFQVVLVAPLSIAGGAVGFADYLGLYWSTMRWWEHNLAAAGVCMVMTALLYRHIEQVGKLSVIMLAIVALTVGWVIVAGLFSFSPSRAFDFPPEAYRLDRALLAKIGAVALLAMYNYGGYNNICNIAEEVRSPERTLPRSILLSILIVVSLYLVMSTVILGMVPWQEAARTRTIASLFIARTFSDPIHGRVAAGIMTALILFVTATSLYSLILGYSRVVFAAARDEQFFRIFARVHPTGHFPHVALVAIGVAAIPFCFFSLGQLVSWLILVQILLQFTWQCVGVVLLRRYRPDIRQPFTMWLYPLPAVIALLMWVYVFVSAPREGIMFAVACFLFAAGAYGAFMSGKGHRGSDI